MSRSVLTWLLILANVAGFLFGLYYYQPQLLQTPVISWLLVLDCPLFVLLFGLAAYIYLSLALQTMANMTRAGNAWLAWIPIVNIILLLNIAKKPLW